MFRGARRTFAQYCPACLNSVLTPRLLWVDSGLAVPDRCRALSCHSANDSLRTAAYCSAELRCFRTEEEAPARSAGVQFFSLFQRYGCAKRTKIADWGSTMKIRTSLTALMLAVGTIVSANA